MRSIADSESLEELVERLGALRPETPRKWGTMTAGEMLCHLGDATASVLARGAEEARTGGTPPASDRLILKWIALRSSLPWPRGKLKTPRHVDPQADGTRPGDFEVDRQRAIDGLRACATASADSWAATHGAFGRMTIADWHRWAYRHTDHHLRQFGL